MKNGKRKPSKLWAIDTEDDSKGNVKLINFFDGETHHTFRDRENAIEFVKGLSGNIQLWCTNLGYDLYNVFGDHLNVLEIVYVGGRVISAKIQGTMIHFRDTLNHWKLSVKEMGKRIGLEKLDAEGNFDNVEYCRRDTEITWRFVSVMKSHYETIGCKLKTTIGATSLDFYYSHFSKRPTARIFSRGEMKYMLKGYYGGRTEIFHTRPVEGNIQYFDFNSLYPSVMAQNQFPILENFEITKTPELSNEGICFARVRVPDDSYLPYLPYRDPGSHSLIFPVGTFSGFWTYFELREAEKLGYKILETRSALEFQSGTFAPFEKFVDTLYTARLAAQARDDVLLSDSYKLIPNNLYGKFAQGNLKESLVPFESESQLRHGDEIMPGGLVLRREEGEFPIHSNVVWAAYTTAYGRHKLFQAMKKVVDSGGLLLYCDTDSVIFESDREIFLDSKKLGELKSEGTFSYAHFKLPKLYRLIESRSGKETVKAKGVPRAHAKEYFERGSVKFQRPLKLKECLRRNLSPKRKVKLIPNYWETTEKEIRKQYDKRLSYADGTTRPVKINA